MRGWHLRQYHLRSAGFNVLEIEFMGETK